MLYHMNSFYKRKKRQKQVIKFLVGITAVATIFALLLLLPQSPFKVDDTTPALPALTKETQPSIAAETKPYKSAEQLTFKKGDYQVKQNEKVDLTVKYTAEKGNKEDKTKLPKLIWSTNNPDILQVDEKGVVTGKSPGQAAVYARTETGLFTSCYVTVEMADEHIIQDVPMITQQLNYPTGCEAISTVMFLQYYGFDITPETFIDDYLPKGYFEEGADGILRGPDVESVFIGSPYSENSLGCFPPVIEHGVNSYFADLKKKTTPSATENTEQNAAVEPKKTNEKTAANKTALDISGVSMDHLLRKYIANDEPVLIWGTMYMWEPFVTYEWTVSGAADYSSYKDGDTCYWLANEHCMVLVGYDENNYYFNDPLYQSPAIAYDRSVFDDRYASLGKGAIVLTDNG